MKKLISVAVILIFIGLAFAPSINANVGKEELVEFTTEVCGFNGGKQTIKLTQKQANEVEALFDSIREQLNATESREEAEEIFNDAVEKLDKYGLLGGLSVKQAQRLVTGHFVNRRLFPNINSPSTIEESQNKYHNSLCLVAGDGDMWTYFFGPMNRLFFLFFVLFPQIYPIAIMWMISIIYGLMTPIALSQRIGFGIERMYDLGAWVYYPAEGNITTYGLNGAKSWSGPYYGSLGHDYFLTDMIYTGIIGFFGLKIQENYLGFALLVGLQREIP